MGVNVLKVRSLYESRVRGGGRGRTRFVTEIRHGLGLCDAAGNDYRDRAGNRVLRNPKLSPEQFSLQELAEAIVGPGWRTAFDPAHGGDYARALLAGAEAARRHGTRLAALENAGVGIDPSAFLNINTYSIVTGGLVEVKILEGFNKPGYIADRLMPAEATRLNGQKVIGLQNFADRAKKRRPNEPHERAQFGERWVETPETRENALAVDVTKEAVFFDLTGAVLNQAAGVGEMLGYRKELEVIDAFIGVTNTFKYSGYSSNTYYTTQTIPTGSGYQSWYVNDQSNELLDWVDIQDMMLLFVRMKDPHTGIRTQVMPDTLLVNPAKAATAALVLGAGETERRTAGAATQATAGTLNVGRTAGNPYGGQFEILTSALVEQRCTDADGLNLSQTNADKYWWGFERGKPFRYMQNWPLTVAQAAPTNYDMLDRGLAATYFANERGVPSVWSPWHVVRNTN